MLPLATDSTPSLYMELPTVCGSSKLVEKTKVVRDELCSENMGMLMGMTCKAVTYSTQLRYVHMESDVSCLIRGLSRLHIPSGPPGR